MPQASLWTAFFVVQFCLAVVLPCCEGVLWSMAMLMFALFLLAGQEQVPLMPALRVDVCSLCPQTGVVVLLEALLCLVACLHTRVMFRLQEELLLPSLLAVPIADLPLLAMILELALLVAPPVHPYLPFLAGLAVVLEVSLWMAVFVFQACLAVVLPCCEVVCWPMEMLLFLRADQEQVQLLEPPLLAVVIAVLLLAMALPHFATTSGCLAASPCSVVLASMAVVPPGAAWRCRRCSSSRFSACSSTDFSARSSPSSWPSASPRSSVTFGSDSRLRRGSPARVQAWHPHEATDGGPGRQLVDFAA